MTLEIIAIIFSVLTPLGSFLGSFLLLKKQGRQQLKLSIINKIESDSPEKLLGVLKNNKKLWKEIYQELESWDNNEDNLN